jgi:hypothetical protein
MSRALFLLLGTLVACKTEEKVNEEGTDSGGGSEDGTDGSTDGADGAEPCESTPEFVSPINGGSEHFYLDPIEVELSDPDPTATLSLTDSSGNSLSGTVSFRDDGELLSFQPDSPLAPTSSYTATVTTCSAEGSASFSTSSLGNPISSELAGKTYAVELSLARLIEPAGVGDLLLGSLENVIFVGVESVSDAEIAMLGAIDDPDTGAQDYCTPSIPFPAATWENPTFQVGPADTTLNVSGLDITINSLSIRGTFAEDGSYFGGGRLEGELDARVLGPLLEDAVGVSDPDEVCNLLLGFGVTCEPCVSDGATYCVSVLADQIQAFAAGDPLVCVAAEDCHPLCTGSTCEDPTAGECL